MRTPITITSFPSKNVVRFRKLREGKARQPPRPEIQLVITKKPRPDKPNAVFRLFLQPEVPTELFRLGGFLHGGSRFVDGTLGSVAGFSSGFLHSGA